MKHSLLVLSAAGLALVACQKTISTPELVSSSGVKANDSMSFFLTSVGPGDGANLGGLSGADAHCSSLAEAAGSTGKQWRAYLSTNGVDLSLIHI